MSSFKTGSAAILRALNQGPSKSRAPSYSAQSVHRKRTLMRTLHIPSRDVAAAAAQPAQTDRGLVTTEDILLGLGSDCACQRRKRSLSGASHDQRGATRSSLMRAFFRGKAAKNEGLLPT